jgi:hypothetical protein
MEARFQNFLVYRFVSPHESEEFSKTLHWDITQFRQFPRLQKKIIYSPPLSLIALPGIAS